MSNSDYIPESIVLSHILSVLLSLWGLALIGLTISIMLTVKENEALFIYGTTEYSEGDFSYLKLSVRFHSTLIQGILAFIGGVLMLFRKNIGWSIALAVGIIEIIRFLWFIFAFDPDPDIKEFSKLLSVGLVAFFIIFSSLLFLPRIRERFTVIRKNGLSVLVISAVVLLDYFLL
ncbi:hypothetical protein K6119_10670 [Paracrocinitomix mangrovi]|uniref:hypothetical protein n=1 Tax=Paracrocinitomix mangrovi TaxID=2862509 RepID=UPI001C8EB01F|nr:hypothetical protein [Paracrocinitomix mangrovi]UKN00195.1 hypothetical protein K6119_10670 [Paracrocinitomix mangrovi]